MAGAGGWWDEVTTADGVVELRVRPVDDGVRLVVAVDGAGVDVVLPPAAAGALAEAIGAAAAGRADRASPVTRRGQRDASCPRLAGLAVFEYEPGRAPCGATVAQ